MVWNGYARVSTTQQAYQEALENAIHRLEKAGCEKVYFDIESRSNNARGGVDEMINDLINQEELEGIKVARLDRLTASPTMFEDICEVVKRTGKQIVGLDENIDLSSIEGQFTGGLQVQFAKRELETIRLRSQTGHDNKRARRRANSNPPFGYVNREGQYRADKIPYLCHLEEKREYSRWDILQKILEIFQDVQSLNQTVVQIHNHLGILREPHRKRSKTKPVKSGSYTVKGDRPKVRRGDKSILQFSVSGLANLIRNPVLRGGIPYNTREYLGLDASGRKKYGGRKPQSEWDIEWMPADEIDIAISTAQWPRIEAILEQGRTTRHGNWVSRKIKLGPISGKVRCGECGAPCKASAWKSHPDYGKVRYYQCRRYTETKNELHPVCSNKKMMKDYEIEDLIIDALVDRAEQLSKVTQEIPSDGPDLQELRSQLAGLELIPGNNEALDAAKLSLRKQIDSLVRKNQIIAENQKLKTDELLTIYQQHDFWFDLTREELREIFMQFLDHVVLLEGKVTNIVLKL